MRLLAKRLFVLLAIAVVGVPQPASTAEPPRVLIVHFTFAHLCVRDNDCGKPMGGILCRPPAFCCDDYCPKPLPKVRACWPKSFCDDYCQKPLPRCWPPDPCACSADLARTR